jgi:hypothetical protein
LEDISGESTRGVHSGARFGAYWRRARFDRYLKGGGMKKFLILLGIIGLVIAVTMYFRNRQSETEF